MKNTSTLYLLCGKMAAGKSTLARDMSRDLGVVVIGEDQLLAALYPGEINDVPAYLKMSARLKFIETAPDSQMRLPVWGPITSPSLFLR